MKLFKRILNRKQRSRKDSPKKDLMDESPIDQHIKLSEQQYIITGDIKDSTIIQVIKKNYVGGPFVDEKINENVMILRKSRFYAEYDTAQASLFLAKKLVEGEFSSGDNLIRCRALAWCARLLSLSDANKAEEFLKKAKALEKCEEIQIVEAFINSRKGDKQAAMNILANLNIPLSRSASLMIVADHEGALAAIDWLASADINIPDLDSDGRYFLLTLYLRVEQWDSLLSCINTITDDDLIQTPALNQIVAITQLISTVPKELRTTVLNHVPFNASVFPLASSKTAIEARRTAHRFFITAVEAANRLNCPNSAKLFDEFALWLGLRDPNQSEQAKQRLIEKLRDPRSNLHLVRLGFQFDVNLDPELVEAEVERHIALHGGTTQDAAIARYALAFTKKNPEEIANYISGNHAQLANYFNDRYLQFLEIDLLAQAKKFDRAKVCLDILIKEGLSETEENHLRRIIAEIDGANPIEVCKEQFRETNDFNDLMILVEELEVRGAWSDLCEYGEIALSQTHFIHDAERLVKALSKTHKYERVVDLIKANPEFLEQSENLHLLFCWALYYEGAVIEARSELIKLTDNYDDPNYRSIQVNLGIVSGDWNSLTAFVAKEYADKDKRSAEELIGAAQLAQHLGSPNAKQLTQIAVEKGNDDASVLLAAYFLATRAGWENSGEAFQWLNKAVELSGDNGPLQKKTLKDILEMKPDWNRRESEALEALRCGDIPMFIAGELLNRSLIHMMLFPAMGNLLENDPRRRSIVPAYSGKRQCTLLKSLSTVAMDATVLLTLSFLKLLDKALDAFETVYIPHSTLHWLFEEKQKASFHQPSRIRDASRLQRLLTLGVLERLIPNAVPDGDLSAQVGVELAQLVAEAKKASTDDTQCIVVHTYPVHRIASLIDEEVDLTEYAPLLSSCQAIVNKLRNKGLITAEEEKKALSYLQLHEKPWPNQPEVRDRAILYLDDLVITYFRHLELLEKLKFAGFRLIISPRELAEVNELTSYECISDQIIDAIENIRSNLSVRIESGKMKIGGQHHIAETEEQLILRHPTIEVIELASKCEAIFVDDRSINQRFSMSDGDKNAPLYSSLDLLDILVSVGFITSANLSEYKTILRRAGYLFVPVNENELTQYLNTSMIADGKVIESAELKAIRENILNVRMRTWLQNPQEIPWLDNLFKTFIVVLRSLWTSGTDYSSIEVRSNWILNQIDIRGWAHIYGKEYDGCIIETLRIYYVMQLLLPLVVASRRNKIEYWNWVEKMVLAPIQADSPELYFEMIERYRRLIIELVNDNLSEEGKHDEIS